ncbi:diguanylate cyclase [Phaeovulum sp. W22_SRMD_FR3]|uniref:diguanylate cyclase n=1 Tax=Phaeovulum sp. W22_SRMD_FR3 TaxID=3240274 RepID=UPI003F993DEC
MTGKILIVDDIATNRIVLKVKLSGARYETSQAAAGQMALTLARRELPDLILMDVRLPDLNGIEVCRQLKADPVTRGIPVVLVTANAEPGTRLAALKAGADDFMLKPLDELVLLARLRSLLRARETDEELRLRETTCRELGFNEGQAEFAGRATVALVAPSREAGVTWRAALSRHLPGALVISLNRDEALSQGAGGQGLGGGDGPDAFVIAADLGRPGDGLRLMSELRSRPATRNSVICIASGEGMRETVAVALDLGASDILPLDLTAGDNAEETAIRLRNQLARKRVADRQRNSVTDGLRMAVTDPLTGLYNRRYALPHLARMAERAKATGRQFAVMVLDLDRFKQVNDTFGHDAGDTVLVEMAQRLRGNLREVDLISRIGGEEFLIAMPETTLETAHRTAERICRAVERDPVSLPDGMGDISITVSIGLAMGGGPHYQNAQVQELVTRADRALMGAKAEGRNQVTISATAA